jgi:rhodanese-related sulfurtransferase
MGRHAPIPALDPLYADIRRRDPVRPALLLDVRERDELIAARIDGSLCIPLSQLGARVNEVPRDRPVMVICATGNRSLNVAGYLLSSGWTDVGNVAGGIQGWMQLGLPVRRGQLEPGEGDLPG